MVSATAKSEKEEAVPSQDSDLFAKLDKLQEQITAEVGEENVESACYTMRAVLAIDSGEKYEEADEALTKAISTAESPKALCFLTRQMEPIFHKYRIEARAAYKSKELCSAINKLDFVITTIEKHFGPFTPIRTDSIRESYEDALVGIAYCSKEMYLNSVQKLQEQGADKKVIDDIEQVLW